MLLFFYCITKLNDFKFWIAKILFRCFKDKRTKVVRIKMQVNSVQNQYTNTSFTSTYRIPLVEQGVSKAMRKNLKNLVSTNETYKNFLYPNGNNGAVRVSIPAELDATFERELKQIGFKVYQKFSEHDVPVDEMDKYIKVNLDLRNYKQYGKQMKRR
jgi:hypothetical protein